MNASATPTPTAIATGGGHPDRALGRGTHPTGSSARPVASSSLPGPPPGGSGMSRSTWERAEEHGRPDSVPRIATVARVRIPDRLVGIRLRRTTGCRRRASSGSRAICLNSLNVVDPMKPEVRPPAPAARRTAPTGPNNRSTPASPGQQFPVERRHVSSTATGARPSAPSPSCGATCHRSRRRDRPIARALRRAPAHQGRPHGRGDDAVGRALGQLRAASDLERHPGHAPA